MDEKTKLAIALARAQQANQPKPNPDGTYGEAPEDMFLNPQTGQMTSRELMTGAIAKSGTTSNTQAALMGAGQGLGAGLLDEAATIGMGEFERNRFRSEIDANAQNHPASYYSTNIGGAIASPVNKIIKPVQGFKAALGAGAVYGGLEGFFDGEGGVTGRLKSAGWGASTGMLFGGMTERLGRGLVKTHGALLSAVKKADERPTMETLRAARNVAYNLVRKSGLKVSSDEMLALRQRLERKAKTVSYDLDSELDPYSTKYLQKLGLREGEMSLDKLDKLRQRAWNFYERSSEPFLLEVVGEIDETISRMSKGNELMLAARDANKRFEKVKLLENAFWKARLDTGKSGSGGNTLNNYRAAVARILKNQREAKWFTAEERALMEQFVIGDNVENTLRKAGKLAPGGNGLMTALNVYAASIDPTMLAVTGAASAAKQMADKSAMRGADEILDSAAAGVIAAPPAPKDLKALAVSGAAIGGSLLDNVR